MKFSPTRPSITPGDACTRSSITSARTIAGLTPSLMPVSVILALLPTSMVGDGMDVAVGGAGAGVGLAGSAGEGAASGAGAAVWPPAIVNDARRAIHVAFNLVALLMRQP